jgi:Dolichyl-phosphate-mannose-protein mannosyltransferase
MQINPWSLEKLRLVGWPLLLTAIFLASGAAERITVPRWFSAVRTRRAFDQFMLGVLALCFLAELIWVVLIFCYPIYLDAVERAVAGIAWWWAGGHAMYPDAAGLGRYGLFPYGPLTYELIGGTLKLFGPSVLLSKLPSLIAFLLVIAGMYALLRRAGVARLPAAVIVQLLIVLGGTHWLWVRPDPFTIALTVLACFFLPRRWEISSDAKDGSAFGRIAALGVIAGLSSAFRIHGALYILPALLFDLYLERRHLLLKAVLFAALVAGITLLPHLVPGAGIGDYLFMLKETSKDGLLLGIFVGNIAYFGMLVLAVYLVGREAGAYRRGSPELFLLMAVTVAGVIVAVIGSKPGAGFHHLLPFLPYLALGLGAPLARRTVSLPLSRSAAVLLLALLAGLQPLSGIIGKAKIMTAAWATLKAGSAQIADLGQRYPGVPLGLVNDSDSARRRLPELARPGELSILTLFAGTPLGFDAAAADGLAVQTDSPVSHWLAPKGFTGVPARCRLMESGVVFDLWNCPP